MDGIAKGKRTRAASKMRKEATCGAENIVSPDDVNIPFFIKIKELPQIQASKSKSSQLFKFCFTVQK